MGTNKNIEQNDIDEIDFKNICLYNTDKVADSARHYLAIVVVFIRCEQVIYCSIKGIRIFLHSIYIYDKCLQVLKQNHM